MFAKSIKAFEEFINTGGSIRVFYTSNKSDILEEDTYDTTNVDADSLYDNILDSIQYFASNNPKVECILQFYRNNIKVDHLRLTGDL